MGLEDSLQVYQGYMAEKLWSLLMLCTRLMSEDGQLVNRADVYLDFCKLAFRNAAAFKLETNFLSQINFQIASRP